MQRAGFPELFQPPHSNLPCVRLASTKTSEKRKSQETMETLITGSHTKRVRSDAIPNVRKKFSKDKLEWLTKRVLATVENAPSLPSHAENQNEVQKSADTEDFQTRILSNDCSNQLQSCITKDAEIKEVLKTYPDTSCGESRDKSNPKMVFMRRDIDLSEIHCWKFVVGDEVLGEGTYGRVYKMFNLHSGEVRAFKRTFIDGHGRGFPSWLMREISLLDCLNHPNIIRLLQVFIGPERVYLSFPYLNGGNVMELLQAQYDRGMPIQLTRLIIRQVLEAVAHCHENRIIHRDLKPENILCEFSSTKSLIHVVLADFGLARSVRWPNQSLSPEVITLNYRPIELLLGMPHYTSAVDIWSTGCILVELLVGPRAFRDLFFGTDNLNEFALTMRLILNFGYPTKSDWPMFHTLPFASSILPKVATSKNLFAEIAKLRSDLEADFFDLLNKILILNPDHRISATDALKHKWLEELQN